MDPHPAAAPGRTRPFRVAVAVAGLAAAAWGAVAAPTFLGLGGAALVAAGAVAVLRSPAVAFPLLFAGASAGPLAEGGPWIAPAVLATVAGLAALAATENPFAGEMAAERERARTSPRSSAAVRSPSLRT